VKKKDASFWSEIKALDERLKREPDSFCFARLSEIYLKVGLVTDAIHTARTGVAIHPGYLAGQRVLAMACNASGLHDESRVLLEQVTAAMPEDVDAQKTLAGLYVSAGDHVSAIRTYRTVLDFRPDDRASASELEALQQGGVTSSSAYSSQDQIIAVPEVIDEGDAEDEIIELSESDIFEEPSDEDISPVTPAIVAGTAVDQHDPLSTLTLAELYEQQGFLPKAVAIYRTILADDPTNAKLLAKIAQLEGDESDLESVPEDALDDGIDEGLEFSEPEAFEEVSTTFSSQLSEPVSTSITDISEPEFFAVEASIIESKSLESKAFAPLANKAADNVLDTLDGWLENIRRIKACR
jgi:tetratricopeptide (TPR) repeat protein